MAPSASELGVPPQQASDKPPPTSGLLLTKIILRGVTAVLTFISLIVLTTTKVAGTDTTFEHIISYRYLLFTILLGLLYSLLQLALTLFQLTSGNRISNILVYVDFYGDLVLLYALATGAAASFGSAIDFQRNFEANSESLNERLAVFFEKGNAAASMVFLGSACSVASLVLSVFSLNQWVIFQ